MRAGARVTSTANRQSIHRHEALQFVGPTQDDVELSYRLRERVGAA